MVYQIVLQDAGYECTTYTDSVKALQEFRPNYYNLILLDIKMAVLNGFELCKKIIEIDKTVHIIFITASEEYYEKFRSQHFPELGKINYIQKPIGNEELVQILNQTKPICLQNLFQRKSDIGFIIYNKDSFLNVTYCNSSLRSFTKSSILIGFLIRRFTPSFGNISFLISS
jgi:two-component SAPR family response regulator